MRIIASSGPAPPRDPEACLSHLVAQPKKKAAKLFEYLVGKEDSLYATSGHLRGAAYWPLSSIPELNHEFSLKLSFR